jgi:hypothetical protein
MGIKFIDYNKTQASQLTKIFEDNLENR